MKRYMYMYMDQIMSICRVSYYWITDPFPPKTVVELIGLGQGTNSFMLSFFGLAVL